MDATAPLMDGLQHILAYAITAGLFVLTVRLMGGLHKAWDAIDISENIKKYQNDLKQIRGSSSAWAHALGYGFISVILFGFAWHFDISSSWEYSDVLRKQMESTLGVVAFSAYILAGLTYLPTFMEMFGARAAKNGVFFAQIAVIGLSVFDLFTDRERVFDLISKYYGSFVNDKNSAVMNVLFEGLYYYVFGLWWILASYGFELLLVCYIFSTLGCIAKAMTSNDKKGGNRNRQAEYADD